MKIKFTLLFAILLLIANSTQAQSKKEIENQLASCSAAKDSIAKAHTTLLANYDSLKIVQKGYDSMYVAVKRKIIKKDFKPANMSSIIDSIQAGGTKSNFGTLVSLNDSVSFLRLDNARLKATIEALGASKNERTVVIYDLRKLKELLDENILTQEEFNAKKAKLVEKL